METTALFNWMEKSPKSKGKKLSPVTKKIIIVAIIASALIGFFFFVRTLNPSALKELGYTLPLPVFTALIAIIDGFNPCTLWVLTFLLVLMMSVSHSRKRILTVGYTFAAVVFVVYFLFMAAWLNIFKFLGFYDPIRIGVACLALVAGVINCKEFFFYRKGVTLMIQDKHVGYLKRKLNTMKDVIKRGTMPALIGSSIVLAAFASLVELPCTAGWPVIYTKILADKAVTGVSHYAYLIFYNLIYILPLVTIITLFGWFMYGKTIPKSWMRTLKLIGGLIMIALGIILLVNPELLMLI